MCSCGDGRLTISTRLPQPMLHCSSGRPSCQGQSCSSRPGLLPNASSSASWCYMNAAGRVAGASDITCRTMTSVLFVIKTRRRLTIYWSLALTAGTFGSACYDEVIYNGWPRALVRHLLSAGGLRLVSACPKTEGNRSTLLSCSSSGQFGRSAMPACLIGRPPCLGYFRISFWMKVLSGPQPVSSLGIPPFLVFGPGRRTVEM